MARPTIVKLPYPTAGIDERVMELDPQRPTARNLDNVNLVGGRLESRKGKKVLKETTTGNVISSLVVHYDEDVLTNQVIYKCNNGGTYTMRYNDIATSSTETVITTLSSGSELVGARISTLGGNYTVIASGTAAPGIWNGTTFTSYTTSGGTYNITGTDAATVCSSAITSVAVYGGHIFFFNKASTKFYSLELNAIAGAVTTVNAGMFVRSRGIVGGGSFYAREGDTRSLDGFAIVGTDGHCAIYTGSNPQDLTTWRLEGTTQIPGEPLGPRAIVSTGVDLFVLTNKGLFSLTKVLLGDKTPLTAPVEELFGIHAVTGMELAFDSDNRRIIINVPVTYDSIATSQFIYCLESGAWSTWSKVQCTSIASAGSTTMGGINKTLFWLDNDYLDEVSSGVYADIVTTLEWSPSSFGVPQKKRWIKAAPQFRAYGTISIALGVISDYETQDRLAAAGSWSGLNLSWDDLESLTWAQWEAFGWASDELSPLTWKGLTGVGYNGSLTMTVSTAMSPIKFVSCSLVFEQTNQSV